MTLISVTDNPSEVDIQVEDVAFVSSGLSKGSCGAPYFASNNKVFAFHVESVDDTAVGSESSHQSYCVGYVLCRLVSFKNVINYLKPCLVNTSNINSP
jgi:hypothetical protein